MAGALWARIRSEFHDHQRATVESLADRGALAAGLDVAGATDMLWVTSPVLV